VLAPLTRDTIACAGPRAERFRGAEAWSPVHSAPWHELYQSDLQSLYAQVALPALFLVYAATRGRERAARSGDPQARFALLYSIAFAAETILDPIATGPATRRLGLAGFSQQAVLLAFVLLGDWRVLLPVFALAAGPGRRGGAFARSAALTFLVPIAAYSVDTLLRLRWPALPGQVLWLVYELGFLALALALRAVALPRLAANAAPRIRRTLRALLAFAATYYALWAASDALILAGVDAGWGLRMLPNQLYYAFTVPFFYFTYFGRKRSAQRGEAERSR
jgi:hypothetical protein